MKKTIIFILLLIPLIINSQDTLINEIEGNNIIQINVTNLFGTNISINYCKFIKKELAWELMLGYQFRLNLYNGSSLLPKDPLWFYNKIKFRIGMRFCNINTFYVAPMLAFNYGFYNNVYFESYENRDGISQDRDYIISREKYSPGCLIKIGHTYIDKRFVFGFYAGLGFLYNIKKTSINQILYYYGRPIEDNYPFVSKSNGFEPTLHIGIQIGLNLK